MDSCKPSTNHNKFCYIVTFSLCFFRILDDLEMYEQQTPFRLTDYVNMSSFLNYFLYKGVLGNLFGKLFNM